MRFAGPLVVLATLAFAAAGCSFVGVRGPARTSEPPTDARSIRCTESGILPSLDALGGAAAISIAGGGVILEHGSQDGEPEHFTRNFAGPLLAVAIVYWISAQLGTTRITRCSELKERANAVRPVILPIGS